jgi:CYTH domain-containing protein
MPIEIERKFLVANDGWKASVVKISRIRDGLVVSENGRKVGEPSHAAASI